MGYLYPFHIDSSTAAGGFAVERHAGRRYRSIAAGAVLRALVSTLARGFCRVCSRAGGKVNVYTIQAPAAADGVRQATVSEFLGRSCPLSDPVTLRGDVPAPDESNKVYLTAARLN